MTADDDLTRQVARGTGCETTLDSDGKLECWTHEQPWPCKSLRDLIAAVRAADAARVQTMIDTTEPAVPTDYERGYYTALRGVVRLLTGEPTPAEPPGVRDYMRVWNAAQRPEGEPS